MLLLSMAVPDRRVLICSTVLPPAVCCCWYVSLAWELQAGWKCKRASRIVGIAAPILQLPRLSFTTVIHPPARHLAPDETSDALFFDRPLSWRRPSVRHFARHAAQGTRRPPFPGAWRITTRFSTLIYGSEHSSIRLAVFRRRGVVEAPSEGAGDRGEESLRT